MTDILIRDWRVPKGCGVCPLNTGAFYCAGLRRYVIEEEHVWMGSNYRRLKDCPLVELPKHGDLIDRDAHYALMEKYTDYGGATEPHDENQIHRDSVLFAIETATVIVPSNKEGSE